VLAHSNIYCIASEKHAGKVKQLRRLKKKHQVDSTENKIEDSSCKPATKRNIRSIFDSGSEDEDFLANEEELLTKNTNGKVSKETKLENVESKDET
jgi:hypothetical protein